MGSFYILSGKRKLKRLVTYAYSKIDELPKKIDFGEGLVGQVALTQEIYKLKNIPENYARISSDLGSSLPKEILIVPVLAARKTIGVVEIAGLAEFSQKHFSFLKDSIENISIALEASLSRKRISVLLKESQYQAELLKKQQAELRQSTSELKMQEEELKKINKQLEEQTLRLEKERELLLLKSKALEDANNKIKEKSVEVGRSSEYKSQFLANMSHELRTPLNSIMVLSKLMQENSKDTFSERQIRNLSTIHKSGQDLLNLIDDILDISKIEAGQMKLLYEDINITELTETIYAKMQPLAHSKKIEFEINVDTDCPLIMTSDRGKLDQIIKNLLSNAIKFTEKGSVKLKFFANPSDPKNSICFSVSDTGIGIPKNKLEVVFEAFQQVDGAITRKYGGTGLGLSVTRELVKLLGGTIKLESVEGMGSVFLVTMPVKFHTELGENKDKLFNNIELLNNSTKFKGNILIIEDNPVQRSALVELMSQLNFSTYESSTGLEGFALLKEHKFDLVILDLKLPDIKGGHVLEMISSHLENPTPVIIYTSKQLDAEETKQIKQYSHSIVIKSVQSMDILKSEINLLFKKSPLKTENKHTNQEQEILDLKKIDLKNKKILVVDDDVRNVDSLTQIFEGKGAVLYSAMNGLEALKFLEKNLDMDLVLMDMMMPEMDGYEAVKIMRTSNHYSNVPVIAVTARAMKDERDRCINSGCTDYIAKPIDLEKLMTIVNNWIVRKHN